MIERKYYQRQLGEGFIHYSIDGCWEPWMKVPDAKTLARIESTLGPEMFQEVQGRIVGIAREKKAVEGLKMRLDTTVTETNIHYPTDSRF